MAHVRFSPRPSVLRRAVVQALFASVIPLGTAFAQSAPLVRVAIDETSIRTFYNAKDDVLMTAPSGTVLEVIYTEGDKYRHRDTNWYWVLLPRDSWGTQRAGWISGRDVEPTERPKAPAPEPAAAVVLAEPAASTVPEVAAPAAVPMPAADEFKPFQVVLNFNFAKSDLTDEAKAKLADAVAQMNGHAQSVLFALEGHADSTGPEAFNEKLGLARAETVKRYLAEQHNVPIEKISVATFGENQPAASNATRDGRAQNRRVLIKVGG